MSFKKIALNKKALFDYQIIHKYEAGIVLKGTEVKSIRDGKVNLRDSFAKFINNELIIINMHISPYKFGNIHNHNPNQPRKLLLHKRELKKLKTNIQEKGLTLIPIKIYLKNQKVKLELALGKGKKLFDKRESIKKREQEKEIKRIQKNY